MESRNDDGHCIARCKISCTFAIVVVAYYPYSFF